MSKQQLKEENINEIKETLKKQKMGLQTIFFKYTANHQILQVEPVGIEHILHHDDYYDNIEDHLTFADLRWLTPMAEELNRTLEVNFEATLPVLPDGSMEHEHLSFQVNAGFFTRHMQKKNILQSATTLFSIMIPFRQYIKDVTFKGHEYSLKNIVFNLELDGNKVHTILKSKPVPNQQVLGQWLATLDHFINYNHGKYKFVTKVPMVNGKMSLASFYTTSCFRFKHSTEGNDGKNGEKK